MSEKNAAKTVLVGIDLGTSQSAIACSNGERHTAKSYVGWPADMVARKLVKKHVLVGQEALDQRTMLDLHRPLEQGMIKEGSEKDLAAVRELLRHLLAACGIEKSGSSGPTVRAVVGVPAEALKVNRQQLRNALKGMVDSLMIVTEPFAVAYGADALLHSMVVDIGAGTTDFCVMMGRYPTEDDQRTLTMAGDAIDELLSKAIRERYPDASVSVHMVREWKEQHSFVGKPRDRVVVTAPVAGKPTQLDITAEVRSACEALVAPVAETMADLLARVEPEFQDRVRRNILLSGCGSMIRGLKEALETEMEELGGAEVSRVKDPVFIGAEGGLAIAQDAADSDWEKLAG